MKITRLQKATAYRIFRNFTWPATGLPEFARFNVIYGWNGSGKSSLSNIFRHIQRKESITEGHVEILVDQTRVLGTDFSTAPLPEVRTFNRDTVDRNIFEAPNQQFPPVFFLGEDSVEKQKLIEELKKQMEAQVEAESHWNLKKSDTTVNLENFCAEEAKGIKNLLTVAGGGPYNNYNAATFRVDVNNLAGISPTPEPLTKEQRRQYLSTKDGQSMGKVVDPSGSFPDFAGLTARTEAMLHRLVVSSVIGELAENPAVAAWVNVGMALHTGDHVSSKCRFCDQPLPEQRLLQLEAHFNEEFRRFQMDLAELEGQIKSAQAFSISLQPKEALYPNLRPDYEKATGTLATRAATVRWCLDVLLQALKAKRDEPFVRFDLGPFIAGHPPAEPRSGVEALFEIALAGLDTIGAAMGETAFDQLKTIVEQHNKHTDGFDAEVKKARSELAQHEVLEALPEWKSKSKAVMGASGQAIVARDQAAALKKQIAELEMQVRQHRRPAEELNQEVAAYLGRDELRFEVEQNGYRIMRGERPATHLSDGERTAIAFLYFLKSLRGTDFNLETGVVVIDDPVSSLDANSLFSAFGFMKQRTATAGQLFVLTHNFTFFRQVRNWYHHLPGQRKANVAQRPAMFYMLATEFVAGARTATLGLLDPFLHEYESEYHYLFKRVHDEAQNSSVQALEAYYAMPNIARRLLEAFLAFRVPDKPGELYQKLECIVYDEAKKTRILRFLHTYSHFDQVAEPAHDPSVLSETPAILREVLALIRDCDAEHFKSMTELVRPSAGGNAHPD